jgi:hypothetical protein
MVAIDLIAAMFFRFFLEKRSQRHMDIIDPAATVADYVVMEVGVAVESLMWFAEIQFLDGTATTEQFQVAINGTKTDFRQFLPNHFVNITGGRVREYLAQFLHDHFPLICPSQLFVADIGVHNENPSSFIRLL